MSIGFTKKRFLLTHVPALAGIPLLWVGYYFYKVRPDTIDIFTEHGTPFFMGCLVGIMIGYVVCLAKWLNFITRLSKDSDDGE